MRQGKSPVKRSHSPLISSESIKSSKRKLKIIKEVAGSE
jgi:hypothetical protein